MSTVCQAVVSGCGLDQRNQCATTNKWKQDQVQGPTLWDCSSERLRSVLSGGVRGLAATGGRCGGASATAGAAGGTMLLALLPSSPACSDDALCSDSNLPLPLCRGG